MAIASTVLGVMAILSCLIPIFGLFFALIALLVAIIAMARKQTKGQKTDLKVIGLILSILATVGGVLSTGFLIKGTIFIFDTVGEMTEQAMDLPEDERVQELMSDLYGVYIGIAFNNKLSREDITKEDAYELYMDVLKTEHRDLYNEGYDIYVDEDLKFEIVPPEAQKI